MIVMLIVFNIVGFATLIFVIYRLFKRLELKLERNSDELWGHTEDATMTIGSTLNGRQMV